MNRNNNYNIIHKVAKHFGSKPKFLYYNIEINKYEWINVNREYGIKNTQCNDVYFVNKNPIKIK